ncbi:MULTISPECIES: sigma factor-like helix-turn-helix DNA-binding protein [unclassified Streptomyces]|uniref:sigma factor-like helix-turn-helix DNA-binding protein n=1 Tax=unclassified Streptomyces TaxID=2593676 RepID=UPI001EF796BF|nr:MULTISPECIES: sigma factor-like helix-turn-helix DNA-binding protein [unclassified Streptomyces]
MAVAERNDQAELLATIPAERRDAFVLTQLLGLPYADAAEAIGCPVGTVRSAWPAPAPNSWLS